MILEFKDTKGALPPPLNLITLALYDIPMLLWRGCKKLRTQGLRSSRVYPDVEDVDDDRRGFKAVPSAQQLHALRINELRARKKFLQQQEELRARQIASRVDDIREELASLRHESRSSLAAMEEKQDARDKANTALLQSVVDQLNGTPRAAGAGQANGG